MFASRIEWRERSSEEIFDRFEPSEWLKIFSDCESRESFENFANAGFGKCWIAYDTEAAQPLAFIFIYTMENDSVAIFHGGGWSKQPTTNYICMTTLLNKLFGMRYRIRTSCLRDNKVAFRFLHSVGFIKYRTEGNYDFLWLSEKRFKQSLIYQRFGEDRQINKTLSK